MKKWTLLFAFLLSLVALFGVWEVGSPVTEDYSWTDSNGENHSIHELTQAGKAVFIFWGEDW